MKIIAGGLLGMILAVVWVTAFQVTDLWLAFALGVTWSLAGILVSALVERDDA